MNWIQIKVSSPLYKISIKYCVPIRIERRSSKNDGVNLVDHNVTFIGVVPNNQEQLPDNSLIITRNAR